MKPFIPNEQQLEAIHNGATKLWLPAIKPIGSGQFLVKLNSKGDFDKLYYRSQPELQLIECRLPLHPGESYFVQEAKECYDPIYKPHRYTSPAEQMTEPQPQPQPQSQYKFMVTGIEIKYVQDIECWQELNPDGAGGMNDMWINRQYPKQPYSSNPLGCLIDIEKIHE